MLSGSPNPDLSQTKKGGGREWGEDFIVNVGPGLGLFPGEGIFESFFTRRVLIDNGTGPLLDIL